MDNASSLKKWSSLRGLAVVSINSGKKVGTVDDFYFDSSSGQTMNLIPGLRVKTGLFSSRALPVTTINAIGLDAVTISDEEMLLDEKKDDVLSKLPLGQNLLSYKVMSAGGAVVGTVGDILIDTSVVTGLCVGAFELSGNLRDKITRRYQTFDAHSVIRYGPDVIVVPDEVAQAL